MNKKYNGRQDLPPYFNINQHQALRGLPAVADSNTLRNLAIGCRKGVEALRLRTDASSTDKGLRSFSTWETTTYLIPVAPAHFRRVLRQNPDLPQGTTETDGGARWFTWEEVLVLRNYFSSQGSQSKGYLPYKPNGVGPKLVTVANCAARTGKSTTCANLALSAALDGYRILVVDLDSQASLTKFFGVDIMDEYNTILPLIAKKYALHLRLENLKRIDRGEAPLPFDDILTKSLNINVDSLVKQTRWKNIDIIGAHQKLYLSDIQISDWRSSSRNWKYWNSLCEIIENEEFLSKYDIIFIDTPSSLNSISLNGISIADILIFPMGASTADIEATGNFAEMLYDVFSSIEERENTAARALGLEEFHFKWDAIQSIFTKFDLVKQADIANIIKNNIGENLSDYRQNFLSIVSEHQEDIYSIYEVDYRKYNRETFIRERISFDESYASFKRILIGSWKRSKLMVGEGFDDLTAPRRHLCAKVGL